MPVSPRVPICVLLLLATSGELLSLPAISQTADTPLPQAVSALPSTIIAIFTTLCFLGMAVFTIRANNTQSTPPGAPGNWPILIPIIAIALAKAGAAALFTGYPPDVSTFGAWALDMYERGFAGFYRPDYFADYPPGYITILWLIGGLANWLGIHYGEAGFLLLLKTPAMLADIGSAVLLFKLAQQHVRTQALASAIALLWLLNPLTIITSAFWGQVDSIFTLVLVAAILQWEQCRALLAASLYAIAILLKPQALLVAPLAFIAWLSVGNLKLQLKAGCVFILAFVLLSLPFTIFHDPLWIFSLYSSTLSSYDYLTLNAFNIYALLGQNWLPNETLLIGLRVSTWAWFLTLGLAGAVLYGILASHKKMPSTGRYLFGAFALFMVFFVVGPKMHERYLFPAALLGFTAFLAIGDKRIFWLAVGTSLTTFINTLVALDVMLRLQTSLVPTGNVLMILCALANVALLAQTLRVGYAIFLRGNIQFVSPGATTTVIKTAQGFTDNSSTANNLLKKIQRKTWLGLTGICVVYSVAAFTYLGNTQSPQEFWNPRTADWAIFDTGQVQLISQLQYHHGLGQGEYTFAVSNDAQQWSTEKPIVVDNRFAEFRWRNIDINSPARYLRIRLNIGSLQMNELTLRGSNNTVLTVKKIGGPAEANALFDEQDKIADVATSMNSMYLDEIYHARSAWEMLQNIDASENTHPPLGKIIIGAGISLIGMNPFGFRFMGVVFGIMMLPVFFGIARRLFRSDNFALVATAFLAVDFMHFTQTRIATIDTYGVFFILASTYFLLRFMQQQSANHFTSLILSGLCFGLGVASKWIVIYHGTGLAILWCWMLWQKKSATILLNPNQYRRWVMRTTLVSVIAFILIPACVYTASYIPMMQATGDGLTSMIANQFNMWNYHSLMKSTHPFSSAWYQWPIMMQPFWYYSGSEWSGAETVSTIIAFGNPVVWYLGSLAFVALIGWRTLMAVPTLAPRFFINAQQQFALVFILIAGLAQFLPWAIIPRKLVFIYHFFASVPFIILALVWLLQQLQTCKPDSKWVSYLPWSLVAFATLLFIAYFPAISGLPVTRTWLEWINHGPIDLYF